MLYSYVGLVVVVLYCKVTSTDSLVRGLGVQCSVLPDARYSMCEERRVGTIIIWVCLLCAKKREFSKRVRGHHGPNYFGTLKKKCRSSVRDEHEGHHPVQDWLSSSVGSVPLLGWHEGRLIVIIGDCHLVGIVRSSDGQVGGSETARCLFGSGSKFRRHVSHNLLGMDDACLFYFSSLQCAGGMRLGINYPELVVFDLDACLWDRETFELEALPDRTVLGDLNGPFPPDVDIVVANGIALLLIGCLRSKVA